MTLFLLEIDGVIQQQGFTGLKTLCDHYVVSYSSANKAKANEYGVKCWKSNSKEYKLHSITMVKISGRDKNFSKRKSSEPF